MDSFLGDSIHVFCPVFFSMAICRQIRAEGGKRRKKEITLPGPCAASDIVTDHIHNQRLQGNSRRGRIPGRNSKCKKYHDCIGSDFFVHSCGAAGIRYQVQKD